MSKYEGAPCHLNCLKFKKNNFFKLNDLYLVYKDTRSYMHFKVFFQSNL